MTQAGKKEWLTWINDENTVYTKKLYTPAEDQIQWLWDVIGYYIGILLMVYIYPIGQKDGKPVSEGLRFGFIIGLIMTLPGQFVLYAHYTLPLTGTLVNVLFQVVEKTVGGIVIALVYSKGKKALLD